MALRICDTLHCEIWCGTTEKDQQGYRDSRTLISMQYHGIHVEVMAVVDKEYQSTRLAQYAISRQLLESCINRTDLER